MLFGVGGSLGGCACVCACECEWSLVCTVVSRFLRPRSRGAEDVHRLLTSLHFSLPEFFAGGLFLSCGFLVYLFSSLGRCCLVVIVVCSFGVLFILSGCF